MRKEDLISTLNKLHQTDNLVNELMKSFGSELDSIDAGILQFIDNLFLDTANEKGLIFYEKELQLTPNESQSISDRASAISAKWRSKGKVDIKLIQAVADAWENGKVEVDFIGGKIQATFTSGYGIPKDLKGLEIALDEIKPAHIPIYYLFRYLLVKNVNAMTIEELQTHSINEFAF